MKNLSFYKLLTCVLFITFSGVCNAQLSQRSTMGMGGSSSKVTVGDKTYIVSASIGQRSVIGTVGNEEFTVRQGFQQPPIRVLKTPNNAPSLSATIFPNPVHQYVTVSFGRAIKDDIHSVLYDIQGREILKIETLPTQTYDIDMSQLAAGTYLLTIAVANDSFTTRLIKN